MSTPVDIGTLIECTPGVVGGRPRIAGTRMPVSTIALYWEKGHNAEDIVGTVFPFLELAGVHAALAYYFANRDSIDRRTLEDDIFGLEAEAEDLRRGGGPPWLTTEERNERVAEIERHATLLRSRLG